MSVAVVQCSVVIYHVYLDVVSYDVEYVCYGSVCISKYCPLIPLVVYAQPNNVLGSYSNPGSVPAIGSPSQSPFSLPIPQ